MDVMPTASAFLRWSRGLSVADPGVYFLFSFSTFVLRRPRPSRRAAGYPEIAKKAPLTIYKY